MSVRDRLATTQIEPVAQQYPDWVTDGTASTKKLFDAALSEFDRIKILIESKKLNEILDSKILLSCVAEKANKDRSLISHRRQPNLRAWISERNIELSSMLEAKKSVNRTIRQASKTSMEKQIAVLQRQLKNLHEDGYRDIIEKMFSSNLLDDRDKLARENSTMKVNHEKLRDQIARLQQENRDLLNRLDACLDLMTPAQRMQLNGRQKL